MGTAPKLQTISSARHSHRLAEADRIAVGQVLVDNCSFEQAASSIISHAREGGRPAYVITSNAQHVVLLDKDERLRDIYSRAAMVVPDGVSLLLAARLFGRRFYERIAGVDLFQRLCELAADHQLRVFLLGGRPGSAELTAAKLKAKHPALQIGHYCPPMSFERNPDELQRTADEVLAARPDLLFVGLGAPKQEYWISEHGPSLGAPISMGVGGTFEMMAGVVRRAPMWIQNLGCEWLHRFRMEPRRMWRRYLLGNLAFFRIIFKQRVRRSVLTALVSLLKQESFSAELHESKLRRDTNQLLSKLGSSTLTTTNSHSRISQKS